MSAEETNLKLREAGADSGKTEDTQLRALLQVNGTKETQEI